MTIARQRPTPKDGVPDGAYFLGAASMDTLRIYYSVHLPEGEMVKLFPVRALRDDDGADVLYFEPIANFSGRVKLILNGSVSSAVKAFLDQATSMTYVVLTRKVRPEDLGASRLKAIESAALERSVYKASG